MPLRHLAGMPAAVPLLLVLHLLLVLMSLRHLAGMPAGRRALSVGASFQDRPVIHHDSVSV